ncbi:microbial collagenase domain protein [Vibrio parahaemolyticus VPTS-2010]|nr:microbial collagenase domain protein [Vibrio parahaemolyticus EKP-021]EXJ35809.1 microbial collagenase domain protein [Vibrio parahaemolyticus VP-48]EXJ45826.1 microbial collagenase domain protein [Vibrio parahaemolyticus VPTS-2010]
MPKISVLLLIYNNHVIWPLPFLALNMIATTLGSLRRQQR